MRHTRVHATRIFVNEARGKWRPKSPKCLMLFGSQLNFYVCWNLGIFVLSCSSLSEPGKTMSTSVMSHPISLSKLIFYKSSSLLHSKFHVCWRLTAFPLHQSDTCGYSRVSGLQSFPPLVTNLRGFRQGLSRPKSTKIFASLSIAWIVSSMFIKAQ